MLEVVTIETMVEVTFQNAETNRDLDFHPKSLFLLLAEATRIELATSGATGL